MDNAKYIVFGGYGYIFPSIIDHSQFARMIGSSREHILGAGFVCTDMNGKLHCYGESISLGIKSRGELDSIAIRKTIDPSDF